MDGVSAMSMCGEMAGLVGCVSLPVSQLNNKASLEFFSLSCGGYSVMFYFCEL